MAFVVAPAPYSLKCPGQPMPGMMVGVPAAHQMAMGLAPLAQRMVPSMMPPTLAPQTMASMGSFALQQQLQQLQQ
eukprot:CAMPEP_0177544846 /NCGR_PEP_ID=MMETSP0369-20130122/62220_1 /TAXON_ID=447022 ORGANISM="Scrippsiella hangoei-like, Strain SHHI-4" /NCGR_SAMPLE_ID=MMETSP0369 /ASSEMBLY_ACC=CAM_ASM_000364 /LENGTH=74 /DNA_ID=CAMNT_0019028935 /DNA_START=1 /DNA_END=222 /DNA_ORIENTATION=+